MDPVGPFLACRLYKKASPHFLSTHHCSSNTKQHHTDSTALPLISTEAPQEAAAQERAIAMAQGRGSATRGLALGGLLAAAVLLLLGVADAATHRVDWSFNADSWSKGKSFRAGDVLGE